MSTENTQGNTQGNGQEPKPNASSTANDASSSPGQEPKKEVKTFDAEYVESLRRENANYRTKNKELSDKVTQFEDAGKTEAQKLADKAVAAEREAETLRKQVRLSSIERNIERAAAKAGVDAELAMKLIEVDKLELGEDGKVKDIETVIDGLIQKWPHLVADKKGVTTSSSNPVRQDTSVGAQIDAFYNTHSKNGIRIA
jgi:hypothetical protein